MVQGRQKTNLLESHLLGVPDFFAISEGPPTIEVPSIIFGVTNLDSPLGTKLQ